MMQKCIMHKCTMVGVKQPRPSLGAPTKTQAEVLKAFGWRIGEDGILQAICGQLVVDYPFVRSFRVLLLNSCPFSPLPDAPITARLREPHADAPVPSPG
jgi:hypothetical protein